MMTDTVSKHLSRIRESVEENYTLSTVIVLHTTNSQGTLDKTLVLLHTVAVQEGFKTFDDVVKICGKELFLKFLEKVEDYYEEAIQIQFNAGQFKQLSTPTQFR